MLTSLDQADMALVARNLVKKNGFYTDAIWLWDIYWGSVHHPESRWPLLQSIITALFFHIFGETVAVQKLVTSLFLLCLICAVFLIGTKLFGMWSGLLAACLVLANDRIPSLMAYSLNDIGASFFQISAIFSLFRYFEENNRLKKLVLAGIWTGVAIHQKFQSVYLVFGFLVWSFFIWKVNLWKRVKTAAVFLLVLVVIGFPLFIRNYKTFHTLVYPGDKLVNALGSAWDPSVNRWRGQMVYYKLYFEHERVSYGYLLKHRGARYLFFERPFREFRRLLRLIITGVIVEQPVFILGLLGMALCGRNHKKWVLWNLVLIIASFSFVCFRSIEPRYYLFLVPMLSIFGGRFLEVFLAKLWRKNKPFAVIVGVSISFILVFSVKDKYIKSVSLTEEQKAQNIRFLSMCEWLKKNTSPTEGIFSWRAGEVAFHSQRGSATIPNVDLTRFILLAEQYNIRYIHLENWKLYKMFFNRAGTQHWLLRQLAPLFVGREIYGFKLVYQDHDELYLYRVPLPSEVDLESLPKLPPEPEDFTLLLLEPEAGGIKEYPPPLSIE